MQPKDYIEIYQRELLGAPTDVMRQYLVHFEDDTHKFIAGLTKATDVWQKYQIVGTKREIEQEELVWSAAYFFQAINSALISTRLFLSGYFVPSGNLARQSIESLAFASLLPFPATGAYKKWKAGHADEYKAVGNLARSAKYTGMIKDNVHNLSEQAKWFDQFSHASRIGLATIILPPNNEYPEGVWNVGAVFIEDYLEQYGQEMNNRISLTDLLSNTIAGTYAALREKKLIDLPDEVDQIV